MFHRIVLAAALAVGAALPLAATAPAEAATTVIRSDNGHRTVVIRRHSDRGWHQGWNHHHRYDTGWNRHHRYDAMGGCRTTTVRRNTGHGVVVKQVKKCY
jgi:hypothetical protein